MARILLLSNGHGEDLSGALLAQELQHQGHNVQALPLVGLGSAYQKAGVPLLGRSHEFSTGGIGYTSLRGRLTEIAQGQVLYLLRRLMRLMRYRRRFDLILVVGCDPCDRGMAQPTPGGDLPGGLLQPLRREATPALALRRSVEKPAI